MVKSESERKDAIDESEEREKRENKRARKRSISNDNRRQQTATYWAMLREMSIEEVEAEVEEQSPQLVCT